MDQSDDTPQGKRSAPAGLQAVNEARKRKAAAKLDLETLKIEEEVAVQKAKTETAKDKERLKQRLEEKGYDAIDELVEIAQNTDDPALRTRIAMKLLDKDIGNMKTVDMDKGAKTNVTINLQSFRGAKPDQVAQIEVKHEIGDNEYDEFVSEFDEQSDEGPGGAEAETSEATLIEDTSAVEPGDSREEPRS